jgi:UDP-N-acetylmuramyl-tripeptide synthetase
MKLLQLLLDLGRARLLDPGARDLDVGGVTDDSRAVRPGDVFVAVKGLTVDGHDFVRAAAQRGAAAAIVERPVDAPIPLVVVPDGARALGPLVARAAGRPSDRMTMVGITGTNGKTTTTYLLESILAAASARPGVIGTVSYRYAGTEAAAPFTTPTPGALHPLFAEMAGAGTTHCVMETSSAALAMARLDGVRFQAAAFTNLTQDHLDVHGTMEAYFAAKRRLFEELLVSGGVAAANVDDDHGLDALAAAPRRSRRLRVSTRTTRADVFVMATHSTISGIRATLQTPRGPLDVRSAALLGEYNVANIALAVAIAEGLDLPREAIAAGVEQLAGVPGRVQRVANARGLDVFVDYAHTPDALERVIAALRPLTRGRLIVVFGCGGDRDRGKRPRMGQIVARDADLAVVTSDNPRTEEPLSIIEMILAGVREVEPKEKPIVEPDRRAAIGRAVRAAGPGDVVLIAGKGHEDYQILGKTKIHFDDREEAAAAISADMR